MLKAQIFLKTYISSFCVVTAVQLDGGFVSEGHSDEATESSKDAIEGENVYESFGISNHNVKNRSIYSGASFTPRNESVKKLFLQYVKRLDGHPHRPLTRPIPWYANILICHQFEFEHFQAALDTFNNASGDVAGMATEPDALRKVAWVLTDESSPEDFEVFLNLLHTESLSIDAAGPYFHPEVRHGLSKVDLRKIDLAVNTSALHITAFTGCVSCAGALIQNNADLDALDVYSRTPLRYFSICMVFGGDTFFAYIFLFHFSVAALYDNQDVGTLLMHAGADFIKAFHFFYEDVWYYKFRNIGNAELQLKNLLSWLFQKLAFEREKAVTALMCLRRGNPIF